MVDLGIETKNMSPELVDRLEKSVAGCIEANEQERKYELAHSQGSSSFPIQRRGQRLPGDVGNNFGLFADDIHGAGLLGPFGNTFPGSQYFSGQFGGFGEGTSSIGGFGGFGGGYGQGSHTAFKRNTRAAHGKMGICVSAYKGFGLAKNVIDLMANFAAEGLKIKHQNKTVERFLNRWAFHVDLQGRVKDILRYYYKYGNVFVYRTPGEIDNNAYMKMRRSTKANLDGDIRQPISGFKPLVLGAENIDPLSNPEQSERIKKAQKESEKEVGKRIIPWRYTLLNPFQMDLRGTKYFGSQRWVFILDQNTVNDISRGALKNNHTYIDFLDDSKMNLPPEFKRSSQQLSNDAPVGENNDPRVVELDQEKIYTMHYMKDDHEDWAEPLLWPVMSDISYKNKLRQMDISVCDSVINAVTIFKLGNLKEGFIPPKEHFSKFAEFLRTPTAAMTLVWNDAIDVVDSYPPVDKILGMAKYESVDRDILRGIGIPDSLIGGATNGNFSTGFLGVRTLLERLEEGRNTVMRWLMLELQLLIETLGIRNMPTLKFGKMSLRDEKAEKQLIIQLLDRNIISIEAVLETFDEDFNIELERLREENAIREETGLLKKHSPYVDPINDMEIEEQMDKESQLKQQEQKLMMKMKTAQDRVKRNDKGPNGRPPGTDGISQDKKRETKPQGMAWLLDYEVAKGKAISHVNAIEKVVSHQILKALGKKTKRSLTKHEAQGIEEITFAVAAAMPWDMNVEVDAVKKTLANNPVIDGNIYLAYTDMKQEDMTLADRKVAMASAIAYCRLRSV